jgi:1,2-diacylglycerol 3-alpha-glucosyltransferase
MYARISLKSYSNLVSPTQTIATIIEGMIGLTPDVISYGLDLKTFHPPQHPGLVTASRKKWDLPSNIPLLLHVGRLDTDKSVENVIRAAAPAIRESDAHLLIVGDGKQKQNLIRLCKEMSIKERVHFTGFIHPSNLPEIYRMANIFFTASEIETQGIVLLEAAASGLPIVAVDATCISEVVHDQINGFLIRHRDINAFSKALLTFINDPNGSYAKGLNGRILVSEHHIQNTWTLHENLYREMIKRAKDQHATKTSGWFPQWESLKTLIGLK